MIDCFTETDVLTFNQVVAGSIPARPTIKINKLNKI